MNAVPTILDDFGSSLLELEVMLLCCLIIVPVICTPKVSFHRNHFRQEGRVLSLHAVIGLHRFKFVTVKTDTEN